MDVTDQDFEQAEARMAQQRASGHAISARFERRSSRVIIKLNTGIQLSFPTALAEGLANAAPENLSEIEISPSGLALHWPHLDADLYIPALLNGIFGSKNWMARHLGAAGGRARTPAKSAAARTNGQKGGRPRKKCSASFVKTKGAAPS
jgi:hypothetical protein